jgi:hypothetical protein
MPPELSLVSVAPVCCVHGLNWTRLDDDGLGGELLWEVLQETEEELDDDGPVKV